MARTLADAVHTTSADLSLLEVLRQPVTELLGVGQDAADALKAINVETIFDLGSSAVFARAASAVAAATAPLGMLPTDVLDATGQATPIGDVPGLPIERLRGVSTATATALATALDSPTLREFVLWPPREVAHELVSLAAGTELPDAADDPAEELRPTLGEYPTERVYYDTLVMLGSTATGNLTELAAPIPLDPLAAPDTFGFSTPAVGALATYEQSWFAQGVTLGQMVHSLALAPGEATRIAVIDWARRTTATATESISESERLDNATNHSRAASEVQNAVADEMQSGGSIATGWAKSTSSGDNLSGSIGGGIAGTIGEAAGVAGFGFGGSTSSQESETNSRATSTSWSVGSKSVMGSMTQKVNDRTEQHATSVRNRRATAVREVSQTEHEQVSTRIVANYNHMHALTVQYWEVVQLYSVSVQLHTFVRTLFLPFAQLDFSGATADQLVARFRGQLIAGALTRRVRDLLIDEQGRVEVRTAIRVSRPLSIGSLAEANMTVSTARMARMATTGVAGASTSLDGGGIMVGPPAGGDGAGGTSSPTPGVRLTVARPGPIAEVLPGDAKIASIAFEDIGIDRVRVDQPGQTAEASTFVVPAATETVDFTHPIPVRSIDAIYVARDASADSEGSMILRYESGGHQSIALVPLALAGGTNMQTAAFLSGDAANRKAELHAHLQANRAYYTQAVLSRLDSTSITLLLSGISWNGKPLADQVEPNPVAVTGNYLVLRAPVENEDPSGIGNTTWATLLEERGVVFGKQDMRLVPIPTGGVFAEAVLGRSNAAEKLDITRFWNWQDSPIPLQPPEIAPVSTGSRATAEDLMPGQLGAPVINVQAPTALPEPAGMSAVLGALAAGNMFRDMSGLAGTQSVASAASQQTLNAATEAGRINSENYKAATTQATEMGKAAADMYKAINTGGGKSGGSSGSGGGSGGKSGGVSAEGARINHGRDMDERGVSSSGSGGGAGGASSGAAGVSSGGGTSGSATGSGSTSGGSGGSGGSGDFSRERAYSDMDNGYSPDMVASTRAALGDGPAMPAADGLSARGTTGFIEGILLQQFRSDAETAGISFLGIDLLPMRRLVLGGAFSTDPVNLNAWTESATRIYINVTKYIGIYDGAVHDGLTEQQALNSIRALALVSHCHQRRRANRMATNQGKPPADFKEWIKDEHGFCVDDVAWLGLASTKKAIEDDIGALDGFTANLKTTVEGRRDWYKDRLNLSSADARAALIAEKLLPTEVQGKADYTVADLYKGEAF